MKRAHRDEKGRNKRSREMIANCFLQTEKCPCKKVDCMHWGQCDTCRENHYSRGKKPYCERKKYLKSIGGWSGISSPWNEPNWTGVIHEI